MPSVTQAESPLLCSSKKRRRDDDVEVQMPLLDQASIEPPHGNELDRMFFHNAQASRRSSPGFTEMLQRKIRPISNTKRMRVSEDSDEKAEDSSLKDEYQYTAHAHGNYSTPPISPQIRPQAAARTVSSSSLSPCHICHRKPTKKTELDSFADCESCGQRTCYVCIRQCQGWLADSRTAPLQAHEVLKSEGDESADEVLSRSFTMHDADDEEQWVSGHDNNNTAVKSGGGPNSTSTSGWNTRGHSTVICSRCCVERGSEGDVMCLGCLARVEGA